MAAFSDVQQQGKNVVRQAEDMPASTYFGIVLASIALSAILFMTGRRNLGIFVGLWPPTILNMALFNKQLHPSSDMGENKMSQMGEGVQQDMRDLERRYGT
jgi:hypothetical protein